MNSVNASTGLSGFQLHMERSPRIIPLIIPECLPIPLHSTEEARSAQALLHQIEDNTWDAKDRLLRVKVDQAHQVNKYHGEEEIFMVGDQVLLLNKN